MSNHRKLLLKIDSELHGDELDRLKFLCMPFISRRRVLEVTSGHQLFECLESNCLINANDLSLLYELLHRIGRKDLCNTIERNLHIQVDSKPECLDHDGFKFYEILYEISEDMGPEEVSSLKYLYPDVPRNKKIKSGIDLFSLLIDRDSLSPTNLDSFIDNFSDIGRKDLVHKLNDFKVRSRIPSCSVNYGEDESSMTSNKTAQQTSSRIPTMETEEISGCSSETHPKEVYYFSNDLARRIRSMQVGDEGKGDGVFQKSEKDNKLEKFCLSLNTSSSFNAEKGSGDMAMPTPTPLVGAMATERDVNVNADRCEPQHPAASVNNKVLPRYKMDATPRAVSRSVVHLSETDHGVYTDAVSSNFYEQEEETMTSSFVCNDQDFLIGYSTVSGNVSFRDTQQGTWYITALTQVFLEYHKREGLQHMLVAVNEQVAKNSHHCANENGEMGQYAQVPAPQHTLTKQLWF